MRFSLFLVAFTCVSTMSLAQFSATMKNVVSGQERIYQVYNDGENYRYEFTEDGTAGVVIVKPLENKTSILMPEKKYVHHTTYNSQLSFMNDPVQHPLRSRQTRNVVDKGEEKVEGYVCKKLFLKKGDRVVFIIWQSEKLNFPLRIEKTLTMGIHYMEVTDIKDWKAHESFFAIPPDYISVDENMRPIIPEPPPPETWTSKSVTLPFAGVLKRGEKIIMDISATGQYKIKVSNERETPTKFIYDLYENGEKLSWGLVGNDKSRTHRIFMDEQRTFTNAWEAGWQLVVEGYEGEVSMNVYAE